MKRFPITLALLLTFCMSFLTQPAKAESGDPLTEIAGRLHPMPVFRAMFSQARHMEALSRPLASEGQIVFTKARGIAWLIEDPYPVYLVITPTHVTEWQEGGARERVLLATRPALSGLASVLVPLLSADFEALVQSFTIEAKIDDRAWRATLKPRDVTLAKIISTIEITGDNVVRKVEVGEAGGDRTHLAFKEYRVEPPELTVEERSYFEE